MTDERNLSMEARARRLRTTAIVAVLIALAFAGTMFIRVPIPATNGYFNIGDMFIILAGIWLGPIPGLVVGFVGPTAADAIGFPQYMLATSVTKGLEGLIVGLIAHSGKKQTLGKSFFAAVVGGVVMVSGYFVFQAFVYPELGKTITFFAVTDLGAAIVEIGPNVVQAIIGAVGGVALWKTVSGRTQ